MRTLGLFLLIVSASGLITASDQKKPVKNSAPLSADEIAVYRAVLASYASGESARLNVSIRTFPLDTASSTYGMSSGNCANMRLDNLGIASQTFHDLTNEVLPSKNMRLVDPKTQASVVHANDPERTIREGKSVHSAVSSAFSTGLFSMSEIGFDKNHRHAVVSYTFWCGSLCGHGSTLIFEKRADGWHRSGSECGGYVS